ncbi:unnamed protein product [Zymoseptoria tritici ST99CH_3D7]|uniref:Uncharacterized protein n=1 Tax=Zymoseptoria tritici (strain ST99CH_3D7) TaxID=1276538 RepID=A0A1X7S6K5_ZYMT9|nr:unnamed protein product [Zymoseptoria tritici ST99CH_3D7]
MESNTSASSTPLDHITQALNATLDPRISNDIRQQALQHLEAVKSQPDAPQNGFALADDFSQPDSLRYYGLQLLEYAVRYRWQEYSPTDTQQLRRWVTCLAGSLREQDALFLRNKIAQLWVEVAKRSWGEEVGGNRDEADGWLNMDQLLVNLWDAEGKGAGNKVLALGILEALSEDIVHTEDALAGLRSEVLGHALNEIMIPAGLYEEHTKTRETSRQEVRAGSEGWLNRVCSFFALCVKQARVGGGEAATYEMCAIKALNTLRPTMGWISLKAVNEVSCVDCLFLPFHTPNVPLQMAAVEVLLALLGRPYNTHFHDTWSALTKQALQPERIAMIREAFVQTSSAPGEDEEKYALQKKMSELLSILTDSIARRPELADDGIDLSALFDLLLLVLQHKSLTVSIPVLHSWTKMINAQEDKLVDLVLTALPTLLQTCSERMLRYEALPDDETDDILQFLDEDFDTIPERHAFLGNYRRYCVVIIQSIARCRPIEALSIVLQEMQSMLENGPYTAARGFESAKYSKTSIPILKFDAQFNVVSAALQGYKSWMGDVSGVTPEQELYMKVQKDFQDAANSLQQWCYGMVNIHTDDPIVAEQILETMVMVVKTLKEPSTSFVLQMVQHLLTMRLYDQPAHTIFSDAVKTFEALRVVELQKIALKFSNPLLEVYNELEPRIEVLVQKHSDDPRLVWGYKAFLFMIVHRAGDIEPEPRMNRLQQMLRPVHAAWTNPDLAASVATLQTFCDSLAMGDLPEFYQSHGFHQVQDWSTRVLDARGQARQTEIGDKAGALPLRMTKSMLAASAESLKTGSREYNDAAALWSGLIPLILPNLLQMLRHAQAFHNMSNYSSLSPDIQAVVKRTHQDRFWQSGISNESKDDFYARIQGSKSSLEGFASTVRGVMRTVRETGYHILYLLTKFDDKFYGLSGELAAPLAEALFADAGSLSSNHLQPVINVTTGLVQRCPSHYRSQFLPLILRHLFLALDGKISAEWEVIGQAAERAGQDGDELGDEMRSESVLRQLTFSMTHFVEWLFNFDRQQQQLSVQTQSNGNATNGHSHSPAATAKPSMTELILSDPNILEPLILFCTHVLRVHDTRCCSMICKVFRGYIPVFGATPTTTSLSISPETASQVREFISTEALKACITSLNEPYFADLQKELAMVIAQILSLYSPLTNTPREVLCSLPMMKPEKVDKAIGRMKGRSERGMRAVVLELLEGVRGVSIYEAGKVTVNGKGGHGAKSKAGPRREWQVQQNQNQNQGVGGEELEGVAGLFGEQ